MQKNIPSKNGRLILSRSEGESIVIGSHENRITITVERIDTVRQAVKLVVEGPEQVPVNRHEIALKKGLI